MENASKALIIAGAILISILIISLGIMIYNQASSIVQNNQLQDFEITAFNTKFTQYEGVKTGAQVKTLLQEIISSNSNPENASRVIYLRYQKNDGTAQNYKVLPGGKTEGVSLNKTTLSGSTNIKANAKFDVKFSLGQDYTQPGVAKPKVLIDGQTEKEPDPLPQAGLIYECIIQAK